MYTMWTPLRSFTSLNVSEIQVDVPISKGWYGYLVSFSRKLEGVKKSRANCRLLTERGRLSKNLTESRVKTPKCMDKDSFKDLKCYFPNIFRKQKLRNKLRNFL